MDSGLWTFALASLLAGLALAGLGAGAWSLRRENPLARRLRGPEAFEEHGSDGLGRGEGPSRALVALGWVARGGDAEVSALRRKLVQGGLRQPSALQVFLAAKVALALSFPLAFLAIHATFPQPMRFAAVVAVWLCGGGFFLPNLWLNARVTSRRQLIDRGLPDSLDLLVTCVEAGLGLDAAMLRVSQDSALCAPALAEELRLTSLETRAGIPRPEAFRRLYERTGCDELKSLAATLAQAEMFGTSVGLALRVQAKGIRVKRMFRAEERAAIVSVKMTIPLVLCILPSLLAVVIGPGAVNIYQQLFAKLGGGH
ncbi:MAG: type II secretion system F family protein [Myxococcales bacterium]